MALNTKHRTEEPELMDDFTMDGDLLRDALDKIAKINQFLGGNQLTLQGVQNLMNNVTLDRTFTLVDVGCGNGDMLRNLADYATNNNIHFNLIGIDANPCTIQHAIDLSVHYPNISYHCENIFDPKFKLLKYDIVLCTLTLHHFKEDEILELLSVFHSNSSIGIVVNDLQRSAVAYKLFQLVCVVFRLNEMSRKDGLVSILRGFKKQELIDFSKKLNFKKYSLRRKWAFRYQWVIQKV